MAQGTTLRGRGAGRVRPGPEADCDPLGRRGRLRHHGSQGREPPSCRRHADERRAPRVRAAARLQGGQADRVRGSLPDRVGRVPGTARRARQAEAERRLALLRAGDVAGARVRLPLRVPRDPPHGDRARAARARVRPRPARDRAERRLPRADEGGAGGRGAQPVRLPGRGRGGRGAVHPRDHDRPEGACRRGHGAEHRAARPVRPHGVPQRGARAAPVRPAAGRDRLRLLRPAEVADEGLRELRLRRARLPGGRARPRRHHARGRARGCALDHRPPRRRVCARARPRRAAAPGDPAPDVRRPRAGGDRVAGDRARDDQGEAEGCARQVLRRRHHARSGS